MLNRVAQVSFVVVLVAALAGCGAHRLKEAQDSFNEAAATEAANASAEAWAEGAGLEGGARALANYRIALALTEEALSEHRDSLAKDRLQGTALMLKALSAWRIDALTFDGAEPDEREERLQGMRRDIDAVRSQIDEQGLVIGTRDRVLLAALPGLYEQEMALHVADPAQAGRLFESALETLDLALEQVGPPADHPVRAYVRLAQLRAVRAWRWSAYAGRPRDIDERVAWFADWNRRFERYRQPLVPLLYKEPAVCRAVKQLDAEFGYAWKPPAGEEKPRCFQ